MKSDEKPTKKPRIDRTKLTLAAYQVGAVLATTLMYVGVEGPKIPKSYGD
jgi:hypothetical protein